MRKGGGSMDEKTTATAAAPAQAAPEKPPILRWVIWLVLFCILAIFYSAGDRSSDGQNVGELVGYHFGGALVFWLAYAFLVARKAGAMTKFAAFMAIYVCMLGGGFATRNAPKAEDFKKVLSEARQDFKKRAGAVDDKGFPVQTKGKLDTTPTVQGDAGEMQRFIKNHLNNVAALRNAYLGELDALGWDHML